MSNQAAHVQAKKNLMTYFYGCKNTPRPTEPVQSPNVVHALDVDMFNNLPASAKKGCIQ